MPASRNSLLPRLALLAFLAAGAASANDYALPAKPDTVAWGNIRGNQSRC